MVTVKKKKNLSSFGPDYRKLSSMKQTRGSHWKFFRATFGDVY